MSMLELIRAFPDANFEDIAGNEIIAEAERLAPVDSPTKIIAVGRNYPAHAAESGADVPAVPLIFAKFPSSITGPDQPIICDPSITESVDFEAELAVVIGRRARNVSEDEALNFVFGYTCLNDVSARDLQRADGQFVRAKSLDTFCPIGPWLVTRDEIPDPQRLRIECRVNGETMQDASTAEMYFSVAQLVATMSSWFTLEPGDIIATGTPAGVGYHRQPPRSLQDGDEVVVSIAEIGELRNVVRWLPRRATRT